MMQFTIDSILAKTRGYEQKCELPSVKMAHSTPKNARAMW
jgi:hypothetical protein